MLGMFALFMGALTVLGFSSWGPGGTPMAIGVLVLASICVSTCLAWVTRGIVRDVEALDDERRDLSEMYGRASHDAMVDGLTGLGNHRAFQDELARQIEITKRQGSPLALLVMDVDNLKTVNDSQGHAAGDRLLEGVGRVTTMAIRRYDRAFRVGGDEFAILLPDADVETGLAIARRILAAGLSAGEVARRDEPFSLSIGVSAYPSPSAESHHLYRNADAALYWCKRHGRTAVVAYDPAHHGASSDDRSVAELSAAVSVVLRSRALRPVYQPIYSMTSGEPIGYEGLVRPTDGAPFSDASALFAAAEAADRTVELDFACLETVAAGARLPGTRSYLSVNLSPRTLESTLFHASELKEVFDRHGIPLSRVVLELTERERVEDVDQLRRNVAACRRAGMRIAADDLGSGNAGLRLLSEIHFDIVKVDLSLIQSGAAQDPSHGVLRALQELATQWQASVVAEGVETAEQLGVIRSLGFSAGQGYLLGRPSDGMPTATLELDELEASAVIDDPLMRAIKARRSEPASPPRPPKRTRTKRPATTRQTRQRSRSVA